MSRESKIFCGSSEEVKHYEAFGWELLGVNGNQMSMTRETQNPLYPQLVKYEQQYEELKRKHAELSRELQSRRYKPASAGLAFILLLLAIAPGVLYIVFKTKQKKKFKADVAELQEMINKTHVDMILIVEDSRKLFFSQNKVD